MRKKPADWTKLCYVLANVAMNNGGLPNFKNIKSFVFKQQIEKRRFLGLDNDLVRDAYLEVRRVLYGVDKERPIISELIHKEAEEAIAEAKRTGRLDPNVDTGNDNKVGNMGAGEEKKDGLL